jgi:hypothetical protein
LYMDPPATRGRAIDDKNSQIQAPDRTRPGPAAARCRLRHAQAREGPGLARQPSPLGVPLHPTSASWLNAVEGFFSILTRRCRARGMFKSVDFEAAIARYIREHNKTPKPFVWTKTAKAILAKLPNACL